MEKAIYKESINDNYVHIVSIDGEKAHFSEDDLKIGTLIVAGAFDEEFQPEVWNFIEVEHEDGVYHEGYFENVVYYNNYED